MSKMIAKVHYYGLPWETERPDRLVLKRWLIIMISFVVVVGGVMPLLTLPEVDREEMEELPPQLARIMLEKPKPPPPPPPPPPPEVEETPPPEKEPVPIEETVPKPEPVVAEAREKAAESGLLQFQDAFADMRDAVNLDALQDTAAIAQGAGDAATIDRSLLTSDHSTRSAGVNIAELSRETGGVALAGRETTRVEAPEDEVGTGGVRKARVADARTRSVEEIRRVFDANKGAIFAIYNRALRQNPALQGQVVLELVIDPNGAVVDVRVVSSEIADSLVVDKIVNRIRLFNFGERDVRQTTISYPVHFLPT